MIGQCVHCKKEIVILGGTRFCAKCKQEKLHETYSVYNQRRNLKPKIKYQCTVCNIDFFSTCRRQFKICNASKCSNHFKNMTKKVSSLKQRIQKAQDRLVIVQKEYDEFILRSTTS